MKKTLVLVATIVIVSGLSGCGNDDSSKSKGDDTSNGQENGISKESSENSNDTKIYLTTIDETEVNDSSSISLVGCDSKLTEIVINEKLSPQKTLETMLNYKEYSKEKGAYNIFEEFSSLKIEEMIVANDFAIVRLSKDLVAKGMCDSSRIRAQITKTLTQFDNIAGVDIYVGDQELSSYFSEKEIE
jgi:hypothetical protein